MAEYIDREAAKDVAAVALYHATHEEDYTPKRLFDALNDIPAADVQPVKHGKWLDLWVEDDEIIGGGFMIKQCSVCKEEMYYGEPRFCPDCGARMDGEI